MYFVVKIILIVKSKGHYCILQQWQKLQQSDNNDTTFQLLPAAGLLMINNLFTARSSVIAGLSQTTINVVNNDFLLALNYPSVNSPH